MNAIVHSSADAASEAIGRGTRIWQFTVVLSGARIGDRVTIKSGVQLWDSLRVGENAVVAAGAVFTRDVPAHTCVVGHPARVMDRDSS